MELIRCDHYRAKISLETCRARKKLAAKPDPNHSREGMYITSYEPCVECDPEGKKRIRVEGVEMTKTATEEQEPVCKVCRKKASEVNKFNYKSEICNACYQKEYAKKHGNYTRTRKIDKEGYIPPAKEVPCCTKCGVKCTEAETFDIKAGLCGECEGQGAEEEAKAPQREEKEIIIDFSAYPKLYDQLHRIAEAEMRTMEKQILYFLKHGDSFEDKKQV